MMKYRFNKQVNGVESISFTFFYKMRKGRNNMNILMIPTWYSSHDDKVLTAGVFHYEQSMALKKYSDVALYFPFDTTMNTNFLRAEERGLLTYRRKVNRLKLFKYVQYINDFKKIKKEFQPDIIHAHVGAEAGKIAVVLGKVFHIPVVITEHNPIELAGLDQSRNKKRNQFAYYHSQANVCVSNDSMNRLKSYFPKARFQVIYNGIIDPGTIQVKKENYRVEGAVNCCIVAAFYSKDIKGYQYLIPAIKQLVDSGMNIALHICGGGTYYDYYVNLAKELGIEENCIFYNQCDREKVYSIMKQMDFSISASIFECSGVSVQEAMLLGKPLVVTKSGGANSLVTQDTAIVVERESTQALVDGIKKMVKKLSQFDAKMIRDYAYVNFEIDQVSKRYMELYKQLVAEKE